VTVILVSGGLILYFNPTILGKIATSEILSDSASNLSDSSSNLSDLGDLVVPTLNDLNLGMHLEPVGFAVVKGIKFIDLNIGLKLFDPTFINGLPMQLVMDKSQSCRIPAELYETFVCAVLNHPNPMELEIPVDLRFTLNEVFRLTTSDFETFVRHWEHFASLLEIFVS